MFKLYNSYTKTIEPLIIKNNKVSMYVCGPTVYNYIHIGNTRPLVVFDVLRRAMEFVGLDVKHVCNITDLDDKIIAKAIATKTTEKAISDKFTKAFNSDVKNLNILKPHFQPSVLDNIDEIIILIKDLIKKNVAYVTDKGDVYFDISKSSNYGVLANTSLKDNLANAAQRLDKNEQGANFVLWKATNKGINFNSPWSKGRPGWHSECVALIYKFLSKDEITIHGGGIDLKFPHHTNEIAQGQASQNNRLASHWVHNGFVQINNQKMAKSIGNTILLKDVLKKWDYKTIKLLFLTTHYQKPVNFTEDELNQLSKITTKINKTLQAINQLNIIEGNFKGILTTSVINDLKNNLNTLKALSTLYKALKEFNKVKDKTLVGQEILNITKLLGLR